MIEVPYNLQAIVAVGFKINNERAVQFREWAGQIVKDYTIQGWAMDVDRLKKGHMFTDEYLDRQLEYIREIRLSERKFYQKITDLYATAFDYDRDADFVAELDGMTLMIETKARGDLASAEVHAKSAAVSRWCRHASEHAAEVGGKSWRYLVIPHDEVTEDKRLSDYLRFEIKDVAEGGRPVRTQASSSLIAKLDNATNF